MYVGKKYRKGTTLVSVENMEAPMISRLQILRKRKPKWRSPFWPLKSYCPCSQSSFIQKKLQTPLGYSHFLVKSIVAIIWWCIHQQEKLTYLIQAENCVVNFSGYQGRLKNWVQKMNRNKGKAGRRAAKITAQNQTKVDNEHTPQ